MTNSVTAKILFLLLLLALCIFLLGLLLLHLLSVPRKTALALCQGIKLSSSNEGKPGHIDVTMCQMSDPVVSLGGREYCETQGMDEAVAWALWIRAPPYVYGARGEESSWARAWAGTDTGPDTTNIDGRAVTVDDDDPRETMYEAASYQAFIRGTLSRFYGGDGSESDDD